MGSISGRSGNFLDFKMNIKQCCDIINKISAMQMELPEYVHFMSLVHC